MRGADTGKTELNRTEKGTGSIGGNRFRIITSERERSKTIRSAGIWEEKN